MFIVKRHPQNVSPFDDNDNEDDDKIPKKLHKKSIFPKKKII